MLGDAADDVTQIGFRIEAVELGGADQTIDSRSVFPASIRTSEQIILPPQGDGAQLAFGGVVVDVDATVVTIPSQSNPIGQRVANGDRQLGFLRYARELRLQPNLEGFE